MVAWVGLCTCLATTGIAQQVPIWSVSELEATFPQPFDYLRGARELSDGRLIVLDFGFYVVNMSKGLRAPLSRGGDGPGEYRAPIRLFAFRGDTTAYLDAARPRKVFFILPSGEFRGSVEVPVGYEARDPEAADDRGRLYAQHRRTKGPKVVRDSTDIVRLDPHSRRADTVAALMERFAVTSLPLNRRPGPPPPFTTYGQWAVSRDGRVAAVSVEPYRVTISNQYGTRITGPVLPVEPVRVTEAHREAWLDKAMQPILTLISPGSNPRVEFRRRTRSEVEPSAWPKFLPPFLPGALSFAPDGMLWILRTTPDPSLPVIDVVDRRGRLDGRLALPKDRRMLCHGQGGVYLIRVDEDGLQYVERYRLPAGYHDAAARSR